MVRRWWSSPRNQPLSFNPGKSLPQSYPTNLEHERTTYCKSASYSIWLKQWHSLLPVALGGGRRDMWYDDHHNDRYSGMYTCSFFWLCSRSHRWSFFFLSASPPSLWKYIQLQDKSNCSSRHPHDNWNRRCHCRRPHCHMGKRWQFCSQRSGIFTVRNLLLSLSLSLIIVGRLLSRGFPVSKLYPNSLLASLNARAPVFQMGFNDVMTSGTSFWNADSPSTNIQTADQSHIQLGDLNGGDSALFGYKNGITVTKSSRTENRSPCWFLKEITLHVQFLANGLCFFWFWVGSKRICLRTRYSQRISNRLVDGKNTMNSRQYSTGKVYCNCTICSNHKLG